jgi:hypothetical protein
MTTTPNAPMPEPPTAIGPEWQPCVKLPITVHVREQRPGETHSSTREGITPLRPDDLIMRGVQGEEYPIGRELFNQTYRMGEALATPPPEPPTSQITFNDSPAEEVIRLDKEGFHYKGQFIADAGEAHRLMLAFLKQHAKDKPAPPTDDEGK